MSSVTYPYDPTGESPDSFISREPHVLTEVNSRSKRTLVPVFSPFYQNNFLLEYKDTNGNFSPLVAGIDFDFSLRYMGASVALGKMLFGGVVIHRDFLEGMIYMSYQALGGVWSADKNMVLENLVSMVYNPRIATWDQVTNIQDVFPPRPHTQDLLQFRGLEDLIKSIDGITAGLSIPVEPSLLFQQETLTFLEKLELLKKRTDTIENDIAQIKTFLNLR